MRHIETLACHRARGSSRCPARVFTDHDGATQFQLGAVDLATAMTAHAYATGGAPTAAPADQEHNNRRAAMLSALAEQLRCAIQDDREPCYTLHVDLPLAMRCRHCR